jgi:uncharacterized integral membrane protein (TIGR00697 family)
MQRYRQPFNVRFWTVAVTLHIAVIAASNYLVQIPLELFAYPTTWATFSFPIVYLLSDLTVRLQGLNLARWVILMSMLPSLILSYFFATVFKGGDFQNWDKLLSVDFFAARIALASLVAYAVGQLLDIKVFDKLRRSGSWWIAPTGSSLLGNAVDTLVFFFVAFYLSSDSFYAENWVRMGVIDFSAKMMFTLIVFIPVYGVIVKGLSARLATSDSRR